MDHDCPRTLFDGVPLCLYAIDPEGRPVAIELEELAQVGASRGHDPNERLRLKLVPERDWNQIRRSMAVAFARRQDEPDPTASEPAPPRPAPPRPAPKQLGLLPGALPECGGWRRNIAWICPRAGAEPTSSRQTAAPDAASRHHRALQPSDRTRTR